METENERIAVQCPHCGWLYRRVCIWKTSHYYCIKCMTYFDATDRRCHPTEKRIDYGDVAVEAVEMIGVRRETDPRRAWAQALMGSRDDAGSSLKNEVPAQTFFGLCEAGKVLSVNTGEYCKHKRYKTDGLDLLRQLYERRDLAGQPKELWTAVRPGETNRGQLGVVLALWKNGLIRGK